jgi:hypothetical protein
MLRRWWLTPTALFRSHMPPVFLRPIHWPKGCWQCRSPISPALKRLLEISDVVIYMPARKD